MKYTVFTQGMLQTNCIILERADKCVVVDIPFGATDAENYVLQHKLQVVAVLLTHGHFDHCGGVAHFLRACNCADVPVLVHVADLPLCHTARENAWGVPCENCFPTGTVTEGTLKLDVFEFQVLETPAHTQGSVVYLADNLMLSGDTLFCGSVGRTDFSESVPEKLPSSLKKLWNVADCDVICGHGQRTTLQWEKLHNPYMCKYR